MDNQDNGILSFYSDPQKNIFLFGFFSLQIKKMLNFTDDFDDEDNYAPIHKGSLSSIFEKNRRQAIKKLHAISFLPSSSSSSSSSSSVPPPQAPVMKEKEISEENLQFNSKLTWLTTTPSIISETSKTSLSSEFTDDFPDLSRSVLLVHGKKKSEKDYNTLCPKIKDGYHCTKEEKEKKCLYQHPAKKEVKEIVSTMRSLKKRVVKDVLKIINEDAAGEKKKMTSTPPMKAGSNNNKSRTRKPQHQQPQDKTKFCKFLTDCKYKSKCNYAHTKDELKINDCQFGGRCKMATKKSDGSGEYEGKCSFIHPLETRDMYFIRHK